MTEYMIQPSGWKGNVVPVTDQVGILEINGEYLSFFQQLFNFVNIHTWSHQCP